MKFNVVGDHATSFKSPSTIEGAPRSLISNATLTSSTSRSVKILINGRRPRMDPVKIN